MTTIKDELPVVLNTETVAELLGVSVQTVRIQCAEGELPGVKIGRRWFVARDRFIEFLNGGMKLGA